MTNSTQVTTPQTHSPPPALNYRGLSHFTDIPPCAVSIADLRRLYRELSVKTGEALERHLSPWQRPADMSSEEFEALKQQAREIGTLTVIVDGAGGERIVSSSAEALDDDKLPENITAITFDSAAAIQTQNVTPLNRFKLKLDFTEPPGFNVYNPWDQPTPNASQLEVYGPDHTWVTAVQEATLSFFTRRRRRRKWLHSATTFNLLNYVLAFPGALWIVYRVDSHFAHALSGIHTALKGALYIYVFLLSLLVFRIIIGGFRWIFPVIEIDGARSTKVRVVAGTVLSSIILALLYDILKALPH
jgi:hypothetical protein